MQETSKRYARLQFVLEKSAVYSSILKDRMEQDKANQAANAKAKGKGVASTSKRTSTQRGKGRKRVRVESDSESESNSLKRQKDENGQAHRVDEETPVFQQPALITGATLKNYQLEGLQWMVSLDQNGISGILGTPPFF